MHSDGKASGDTASDLDVEELQVLGRRHGVHRAGCSRKAANITVRMRATTGCMAPF